MNRSRSALMGVVLLAVASPANAQVKSIAEMTVGEIRALDRARTVIILPGGILEQHADHLPSFSDGFMNQSMAGELARAVAARPGWSAVMFPIIPLGSGGANEIGGKYSWPGTYAVRPETLRAIFMDLATELGEQGFRWVFVVHNHRSPWHNEALDQAGDYFRDTYGGRMVNLTRTRLAKGCRRAYGCGESAAARGGCQFRSRGLVGDESHRVPASGSRFGRHRAAHAIDHDTTARARRHRQGG